MIRRVSILLILLISSIGAAAAPPLTIAAGWIRATPPGARTAAAYLTITNTGPSDRLVGASTSAARTVEVHANIDEGGLSRMAHLSELPVPAGGVVQLAPGSDHLMLIDLAGPLVPGTSVMLKLHFAAAGDVEIEVPVIDARATPADAHGNH